MNAALEKILPPEYDYIVISSKVDKSTVLEAVLRVNIFTEESGKLWISQLEDVARLNYSCSRTFNPVSKVVFKRHFQCHHNTRASCTSSITKIPHAKHTNCPAFLRITVKKSGMKRSKDPYLKSHPTEIFIRNDHNHEIDSADILRHRRPNAETQNRVKKLFESGHSPSTALDAIKYNLHKEHGSRYFAVAADGAICPSLHWMYYFYYKTYKKRVKEPRGKEMANILNDCTESHNECDSVVVIENETILDNGLEECQIMEVVETVEDNESEKFPENQDQDEVVIENETVLDNGLEECQIMEVVETVEDNESEKLPENQDQDEVEILIEELKKIFEELLDKAKKSPELLNAVKQFIINFKSLKTDSDLIFALTNFGKNEILLEKSKRNCTNYYPTGVAKRNLSLGRKKNEFFSKPPKRARTREHAYNKENITSVKNYETASQSY